jgi:3-methyladenine DNA glycosylase Tag
MEPRCEKLLDLGHTTLNEKAIESAMRHSEKIDAVIMTFIHTELLDDFSDLENFVWSWIPTQLFLEDLLQGISVHERNPSPSHQKLVDEMSRNPADRFFRQ